MAIQELNKAEIESVSGGAVITIDTGALPSLSGLLGTVTGLVGTLLGTVTGLLGGATGLLNLGGLLGTVTGLLGGLGLPKITLGLNLSIG